MVITRSMCFMCVSALYKSYWKHIDVSRFIIMTAGDLTSTFLNFHDISRVSQDSKS